MTYTVKYTWHSYYGQLYNWSYTRTYKYRWWAKFLKAFTHLSADRTGFWSAEIV